MSSNSLKQITPIVLTFNEEINIGRTLESLRWADRVVLLDSGSSDNTETIAKTYTNVDWHAHPFDSFRSQWEYARQRTDVSTEYVLALDADMAVPASLVNEMEQSFLTLSYNGGLTAFDYRYHGNSLAGSICPAQIRLFRTNKVKVTQPNHGHKFSVDGPVYRFHHRLIHDDRKPVERWVESQLRYLKDNELALSNGSGGGARANLRKFGLMPPAIGLLAYLRAGGPFKGAAAARYAYERMTAESILAIRLMDLRLERSARRSK